MNRNSEKTNIHDIKNRKKLKKRLINFERLKNNKKASGDQLISIWLFVVLGMVVGGITIAMMMFYSSPLDTRLSESEILFNKLSSCVSSNWYLKEEVLQEDFDVYSECNLNKDVFTKTEKEEKEINYYLEMSFYKMSGVGEKNRVREPIFKGDLSKRNDCLIYLDLKSKGYPRCRYRNASFNYFNISSKDIEQLTVEIMAVSNSQGRSVKENV